MKNSCVPDEDPHTAKVRSSDLAPLSIKQKYRNFPDPQKIWAKDPEIAAGKMLIKVPN